MRKKSSCHIMPKIIKVDRDMYSKDTNRFMHANA